MNVKARFTLWGAFLASLCISSCSTEQDQRKNYAVLNETDTMEEIVAKAANVVPSERQFKWQRQELTAFLHYGINTYTNQEWGDGTEDETLFQPTELDADQWISTLKEAGFQCAILTCKHHDGFCLWPSEYTEHSVKNSPWMDGKGDVVRQVSEACKRHDMKFGVYLSPWDRNNPQYGTDAYNDYFVNQLTELLTQYGDVAEVWFDGACGEGPNGKRQVYDFTRWYQLIRELQPNAVIAIMGPDVRWVGTETGQGRATEWSVVPNENLDQAAIAESSQKEVITQPTGDMTGQDLGSREKIQQAKALAWYPAEVDVSIRPGWFYHETEDANVKSGRELMNIYFTSVGMNGVLLLNIPPDRRGKLADADVEALMDFKRLQSETFGVNLLADANVKATKGTGKAKHVVDGNYDSSYSPEGGDDECIFDFELKEPVSTNVLGLQEDIRQGQRVESFYLECKDESGAWKTIATGTTIGYKRLLKFDMVTSSAFRLHITQSRLNPYIAEVGLYRLAYEE